MDSWRTETYFTTEFIPGQDPPTIVPRCWNTPCFCKEQGHEECPCDEGDGQPEAQEERIEALSVVSLDRPLISDLSASIEVGQFVSANDPRDRGPVIALNDLTAVELRVLVSAVVSAWDRLWQEADFDDERIQINLVFENGTVLTGRPVTILDVISAATNSVQHSDSQLDMNGDGQISPLDHDELIVCIERSQGGGPYPSHADLNADGFVSHEDLYVFQKTLSERQKTP